MAENTAAARLSRQEISDAVSALGWRLVLGGLRGCVPVGSLREAADVAARVVASGPDADGGLELDLRSSGVLITLRDAGSGWVTPREIGFARLIGAVQPELPGTRPVQALEIAIDALEIARVRPFWKAIMGYVDEPGGSGPEDAIVDPLGQGPAIWFQQMNAPRPQRNRIHVDISIPHDEAARRIEAATSAGGAVINAAEAPAFWVLADAEGNEACVTTWQGRD